MQSLKEQIEILSKFHHVEILRLLKKENCVMNENNNGTFINLSKLDSKCIMAIDRYLKYVIEQQSQLKSVETEREQIEKDFFINLKDGSGALV
jgi:hypothetical protein